MADAETVLAPSAPLTPLAAPAAERPPTPTASRASDRSLIHGIAWTGGVKWLGQIVTWTSMLVAARLLVPEDYGLVGMATMFFGLVTLLCEFGIGVAVLYMRDLTEDQLAQINGLAVIFGVVGLGIGCAAAVPLGWFFHSPRLPPVVAVTSLSFVLLSLRTVPNTLLQREFRFRTTALVEGLQAIVFGVATIVLAFLGFRYWALVLSSVLAAGVSTAALLVVRRHRLAWPTVRELRPVMVFSWHQVVWRLSWYAYSNADFLVVGRVLGQAALGIYSLGWTLANVPIEKVSAMVGSVTPSFLSAHQKDHASLRRFVLTITEGLALVTFPLTIGLALVADDFVAVVLGPKWGAVVLPLRLLALYASVRSITPLIGQVLNVIGETRFGMWNSLLTALVLFAAFLFASRFGPAGVAAAWSVAYPIVIAPVYIRVFRRIGLELVPYLRALWPAFSATAIMALSVFAMRGAARDAFPPAAALSLQIAAGAVSYAAAGLLLHRHRLLAFRRALADARS